MTEKNGSGQTVTEQRCSERELTKKQQIQLAKDRLLGELIGLSKAICGSINEERFAPDPDTHRAMLEGLAAVAGAAKPVECSGVTNTGGVVAQPASDDDSVKRQADPVQYLMR